MGVFLYVVAGVIASLGLALFAVAIKKMIHDTMSIEPNTPQPLDFTGIPLPVAKRRTMDIFDDEQGLSHVSLNPFGRRRGNITHVESDGMTP